MWKQSGAFLVLQSVLNQGGLTSTQRISHSCSFGLFFFPGEFCPLIFSWHYTPITPLVLKARLTFVAAATSQLNPHVYLEKCQSFSSPRTQTLQWWLMAAFPSCSKSLIWATFTWRGSWNSNGNPWTTFPMGARTPRSSALGNGIILGHETPYPLEPHWKGEVSGGDNSLIKVPAEVSCHLEFTIEREFSPLSQEVCKLKLNFPTNHLNCAKIKCKNWGICQLAHWSEEKKGKKKRRAFNK